MTNILVTLISLTLVNIAAANLTPSCDQLCDCHQRDIVNCSNTNLDNIPHDLDPGITMLDLSNNNINYISHMQFYPELEDFNVSRNNINMIKEDSFTDSSNLLVLDMNHNKLRSIDSVSFKGLASLKTLILSNNEISKIEAGSFSICDRLHTLDLSGNKLSSLDPGVLRGRGRSRSTLASLSSLDLSDNLLGSVPTPALQGLPSLTRLVLSRNPLRELSAGAFDGISLYLTSLELSDCGLYSIADGAFYGLGLLEHLDISDNRLFEMPNFNNTERIEELSIGSNSWRSLTRDDFQYLPHLRHFSMEGCNTDSLILEPGVFTDNKRLQSIKIQCQGLESISDDVSVSHLSRLTHLSFHGSSLTSLPKHLANYQDLATLDLSSNLLHCDCSLTFLHQTLNTNPELDLRGHCHSPEHLVDMQLRELNESDLVCDENIDSSEKSDDFPEWLIGVICPIVIIVIISFTMLVIFYLRRKMNETPRKKLSASFRDKRDIVVIQKENIAVDDDKFIPLRGLDNVDPEYQNLDLNSNQSEHMYADIFEVKETVPNYNIPIANIQCPDVKVSMI